ncbi:glycosyltransferase [Niabella ginsengisoli]|uniref:Glycosyltransferase n=1 Tax=Niabella ginsengisoli TaxID=522298 RepID=A0ABS9SKC5_9BACT|nr:glycosyltransferase [Niabella ginsengisoli]MCH5598837.1 glycosyltransferase [Niabella ginsengisoli]
MDHKPGLLVFSHLRWNFVYQRPQHLISRFSNQYNVLYIEEAVYNKEDDGFYAQREEGITIVVPHLNDQINNGTNERLTSIINTVITAFDIEDYLLWYYTPMALEFTRHLYPELIIYDCMDQLSAFKNAPTNLLILERELLDSSSIVFTGGRSLFNEKKQMHANIHCFPSSIDASHFSQARQRQMDPPDQSKIPFPRFGFFGVIDEIFDIELLDEIAQEKPEWHFVLIGPVVKIDEQNLPRRANIHYLGMKKYAELPSYISGWNVAVLPFALNEATRYISPTKTPEYLAAGKPVISTAVEDVIDPYGTMGLVSIAHNVDEFIAYGKHELETDNAERDNIRDEFLKEQSWDLTWEAINNEIIKCLTKQKTLKTYV